MIFIVQRNKTKELIEVSKEELSKLHNRDKIFFSCQKCRKDTSRNKENFKSFEEFKCSECNRKETNLATKGVEGNNSYLYRDKEKELAECSACHKIKHFSEMSKNSTKKNGIDNKCTECSRAKTRDWTNKNRERKREADKEYRLNNIEILKVKKRLYYIKHREYRKSYMRDYYQENTEKVKEKNKKYRKTERGKLSHNASNSKRRAKQKETDITIDFLNELWENTSMCELCSCDLSKENTHLDHIIPINIGGKHTKDNVRYICNKCNTTRPRDGSDLH